MFKAPRLIASAIVFPTVLIMSLLLMSDITYICCFDLEAEKYPKYIVGTVKILTMSFAIIATVATYTAWPKIVEMLDLNPKSLKNK